MNAKSKLFDCRSNAHALDGDYAVGYLINEHGKTLKITEAMIKRACVELKSRCQFPTIAKH